LQSDERMHRVLRMFDATPDAVLIFDAVTLRYSFVNEGAAELTGYSKAELLTMTPMHLMPGSTEGQYRRLVDVLVADDAPSEMLLSTLLRKDGLDVTIETTFRSAPTGEDGHHWVIVMARNITARLAGEASIREAEQVMAMSEDRERIARDLHDTVIQRLFGEGLRLQATLRLVDEPTRGRLQTTIDTLDETIKELRMTVFFLQGANRSPGGLRGRLLAVTADAAEGLGFDPRLQFDGPVETTSDRIAEHLVAVLREALANISRHAGANAVRVSVLADDHVTLTVSDDGAGIPDQVLGGRGLTNMAHRARSLGGVFSIGAQVSGGSLLTWSVPSTLMAAR
jgi:PAS domain S-box-containing protein